MSGQTLRQKRALHLVHSLDQRRRHADGLDVPVGYVPDDPIGDVVRGADNLVRDGIIAFLLLGLAVVVVAAVLP